MNRRPGGQNRPGWGPPLLWLVLIYSTLGVVRPVCEGLRNAGVLEVTVNGLMVAAAAGLIWFFYLRLGVRRPSTWLLLAALFAAGGAVMAVLPYPEERVHLPQYALLAALLVWPLRARLDGRIAWPAAIVLGALAGWGDEAIQHILPSRHFNWRDVGLNAAGTALGLLISAAALRDRR